MYGHKRFDPHHNRDVIKGNRYPGRMVIVARISKVFAAMITVMMGRSPRDSQNRVYEDCGVGSVWAEIADPQFPPKDPELTIYRAMATEPGYHVISNGNQTETVCFLHGGRLQTALQTRDYEPDGTPRITAVLWTRTDCPRVGMSILRKAHYGTATDRDEWDFDFDSIPEGTGYCLTTYMGNADPGQPLPAFDAQPFLLAINGKTAEEIANDVWPLLDSEYRVGIAVKMIDAYDRFNDKDMPVHIINQRQKVVV